MKPTELLFRRSARTLPHEQKLNRKVRPSTKPDLKDTKTLAPRLPRIQAGLRIRLVAPQKGARVKTVGYRIVVNDGYASPSKTPIEQIGNYDPRQRAYRTPGTSLLDDGEIVMQKRLEWNEDRLSYWLAQGARPSSRMMWLMQVAGICASILVFPACTSEPPCSPRPRGP
jgi:ribosomal protein S16